VLDLPNYEERDRCLEKILSTGKGSSSYVTRLKILKFYIEMGRKEKFTKVRTNAEEMKEI